MLSRENSVPGRAAVRKGHPAKDAPSLLIIEDNQDLVRYLTGSLQQFYRIEIAHDGEEGIAKAIEKIPDIIVTDIMMPGKNGYELCHELKNHQLTSHIPVLMLTARADRSSRLTGWRQGADAYMEKPFLLEELQTRINSLLEQRRKLQDYYRSLSGLPGSTASEAPVAAGRLENEFLQRVSVIVEANLDNTQFSVEQLSREVFISPSQLYRKLKALTGLSPIAYIRKKRLVKARQLLADSRLSIATVAGRSGFEDPKYFSRIFKREFGESPTKYRSKLRS